MIRPCSSYTNLLTLQAKPTYANTMSIARSSAGAVDPPPPWMMANTSPCVVPAMDEKYIRSTSPLTVVYDNEEDYEKEEQVDKRFFAHTVSTIQRSSEPLKQPVGADNHTSRVRFGPDVQVAAIPSHRDYSPAMKQRIWSSRDEIRVNAVKAKTQLHLYGAEMDDDVPPVQPTRRPFAPLPAMQRAL